ncbi:MAG: THUMP domain-containing class I SAM-dependent RNA methyltransferase [Bacteroidota bacterium]
MEKLTITLKTLFGAEQVLQEELNELGYQDVKPLNRAVQITGSWRDVYFLNLHTRCAISIVVEIATFRIRDEKDLYKQAKKIDWTQYFSSDKTFAVKGSVFSTLFSHTQYPFLLVKDAIVDTFREKEGIRPDVNIKKPQVLFDIHIKENLVTLSLNTSGLPLYMRGYREEVGMAPLNEVLAAVMIRMSGWDRKSTFMDPFCGSGTLLIEAALLAANIPSCIERQHFAFKNFNGFDSEAWEIIQSEARRNFKKIDFELIGSDLDSDMIFAAKRNIRPLQVARNITLSVKSFDEWTDMGLSPGTLICNPPYGERMGEEVHEMYENLGNWFKKELPGFSCWVISSNLEALKFIGLKPTRKIKLYNGDLECSFREFRMFSGSRVEEVMRKLEA